MLEKTKLREIKMTVKKRKHSWKEDERILKKDVIPAWGKKKLDI